MIPYRMTAAALLLAVAACSPALDWREIRPEDSGVIAMFPCKPKLFARQVPLAGAKVEMRLASCMAKDTTYAIGYANVVDPGQVTRAIEQLRGAAAVNIGAAPAGGVAWSVSGMTPNPLAEKVVMTGHDAEGKPIHEQAVFFVKGLRVYQATMVGPVLDPEAAETFFGGLKLVS
jgi:hypothetical protein